MPSNQRWGWAGYVEGDNMYRLTCIVHQLAIRHGWAARIFWSEDGSTEKLASLCRAGNNWLKDQEVDLKCQVSLHSDSGDFSHVFGIWGRDESEPLAREIAERVGLVFGTNDVRVFNHLGTMQFWTYLFNTMFDFPSVLIECGSHQHDHDRAILITPKGRWQIGQAVFEGIKAWTNLLGAESGYPKAGADHPQRPRCQVFLPPFP